MSFDKIIPKKYLPHRKVRKRITMGTVKGSKVRPVINHVQCKGRGDCVEKCPENVFEMRILTKEEKKSLSRVIRFLLWVNGGQQPFVVSPENCRGCGTCIEVCPKNAIKLRKCEKN